MIFTIFFLKTVKIMIKFLSDKMKIRIIKEKTVEKDRKIWYNDIWKIPDRERNEKNGI